jgi:diguanylate cyclase (GGDEF)-like protein/PAS domain S-box-containing protein
MAQAKRTSESNASDAARLALLEARNAELEAQLATHRDALEHMHQGLCMFDPAGTIAVCNRRYAEILRLPPDVIRPGLTSTEVIQLGIDAGHYPVGKTVDEIREEIRGQLGPDSASPGLLVRDGRSYAVNACITARGNAVATCDDITAQVEAESALRESEGRLRAILDAMPDCVKIFDADCRIVHINPKGLELLQVPDLETLNASGHVPLPAEHLPQALEVHRRVMEGESVVWEYEIIGMKGRRRHVEAHAVPFRMPDGTMAHMSITRDVNDRREADEALRHSEERLRLVQEATGLADFESGPDGLMIASERFFEQLGLPVTDGPVDAKAWAAQVHPDDIGWLVDAIEGSMARGEEVFRREFRIVRADTGETRWLACCTRLVYDENGVPLRTIGAHLDITERKRAENALQRNERRLRLVQDATGLADFETDDNGIMSSSGRFFAQIGMPPREEPIKFAEWLEHVHPDDRERLHEEVLRSMSVEDQIEHEFRITRADTGEVRWLETHTAIERNDAGEIVRCIGAHFDITDRKRIEEALRQSEARLSAILDAMPDCVKIFDEHGRLVYINPRGLELLEAPDLAALNTSGHVPVPAEYLADCIDVHNRVIAGETVVWRYEILGMGGRRYHVEAHAVPFRMPDGAKGHMCISRDITQRKQADDALRRSEQRLRLVQEATGLADFEAGPDGIAHISETMVEQMGLPRGTTNLTLAEVLACVHPEDRERLHEEIERSLGDDDTFHSEFRIVRPDTGEIRWIHSQTKMERDENGHAIRSIGAHLDITERKRAEEALRESEERFRLAAEAAGLGVWDYDETLDRREWSDRLRDIFGMPNITLTLAEAADRCLHPSNRDRFLALADDLKSGKLERFEEAFRINRADDGRERWVAINAWRTHKAEGEARRIIMTVRDVTEEKTAEERIRWSASHDSLTRLANRALFQERLGEAIRQAKGHGKAVGVLLLDLDHFKQINDSLGHDVGDALLKNFADRLRSVVRTRDTVARLGGDEFAIVVPSLSSEEDLVRLARSIQERMRAPFVSGGRMLDCRVSAGASVFPTHGNSAREVLKNADVALYAAKAAGRATVMMYDAQLREDMQRRLAMVQLARNAIADDRVIPYYQPKLDLQSGTIDGFEALLRWRTPRGRIGQPSALEAAFEDLEVAAAISDRMIDRVIVDMRGWLERGIAFRHVAINASAAEFRRDNFAERVLEQLARAAIPTRCFQIEVTETVFLGRGAEYVHRALALLNAQGVKIALDDFGTGYASLRHLKKFPVDIIKIDQSFVRDMAVDPGDEAIVRAVINLGKSLGINVVAEGIESDAQAQQLVRLGCDFGQGFLFSKAVGASRVPALVGGLHETAAARCRRPAREGLRLVGGNG